MNSHYTNHRFRWISAIYLYNITENINKMNKKHFTGKTMGLKIEMDEFSEVKISNMIDTATTNEVFLISRSVLINRMKFS